MIKFVDLLITLCDDTLTPLIKWYPNLCAVTRTNNGFDTAFMDILG